MYVRDEHQLRDAHAAGNGTILALPHMGNWDHAGAWLVLSGVPFTTVAERLEPAALFDRFVAFREELGFEVLAVSGERTAAVRGAERTVARPAACSACWRTAT